ncbi:MAG: ABC-type sugar transport system ATPase subunit [Flavobacteriales bacterium]|jgi:ABC-type sugar transport system ATPase subunit
MLEVKNIRKQFGDAFVLKGIDLCCAQGQTLSVLGDSGCGKTTLLKAIAGLIAPDEGSVLVEGIDLTKVPSEKRGIVYLSQEPSLFPHLSAFENIAFGLRIRNEEKVSIARKVKEMLVALGLEAHGKKLPGELSGGQKQRVAFGRALVIAPKVLLLDEPFGSLDAGTRSEMQQFYLKLAKQFAMTSLFITHDLKEALVIGDQFARMEAGKLTVYLDLQAFTSDPVSGVKEEITFWNNLKNNAQ